MLAPVLLLLASAPELPRNAAILLLDLKPLAVPIEHARSLTAELAARLGERGLAVATQQEVNALLALEELQAIVDCDQEASCLSHLIDPEKAQVVLSGSFGQIGSQWLLNVSLIDTRNALVLGRAGLSADTSEELREQLPSLADDLFGRTATSTRTFSLIDHARFVVLEIRAEGVDPNAAKSLTEVVAHELKRMEGSTVLSQDEIAAMISAENLKTVLRGECDSSCFVEIAGALDAQYILLGRVGRLHETSIVSLTLLDQRGDFRDKHRVSETFRGPESELIGAVRHAVRRLVAVSGDGRGRVAVSANETPAEVYVDNRLLGVLPFEPKGDLREGRHTVRISRSGYFDWESDFYVLPNDTAVVWGALERRPEAWYEKWWVWTIIGVAAAAGTTAIVLVADGGPDSGRIGVTFE